MNVVAGFPRAGFAPSGFFLSKDSHAIMNKRKAVNYLRTGWEFSMKLTKSLTAIVDHVPRKLRHSHVDHLHAANDRRSSVSRQH